MFEWDEGKNTANRLKHGISFEDILPIFNRVAAVGLIFEDTRQNYGETRFILLCPFNEGFPHDLHPAAGADALDLGASGNRKEVEAYEQRKFR
jgi:ribonuclease toxin BrnT of type II toxin-antitoxin system